MNPISLITGLRGVSSAVNSARDYLSDRNKKKQQQQNTNADYRSYGQPANSRVNLGTATERVAQIRDNTTTPGTLPTAQNIVPTVSGTPITQGSQSVQTSSQPSSSYSQPAQTSVTREQAKEALAKSRLAQESQATQTIGTQAYIDQKNQEAPRQTTQTPQYSTAQYQMQGAPQVQSGVTNKTQSFIDKLRSQVGSLQGAGEEERKLQDELTTFQENARMGISGREGQGRGIPLSLIRGEQSKLAEQAGIQEQTLLDRLAAATAQRQAGLQAAQTQLDYATQEQQRQDALTAQEQQRRDKLTAPMQVGNSVLQFDPATGQYKTVYSAPAEPEKAADAPTSVQEYQYATQSGYTGSYTDFLAQKAAFSQNPANYQYTSGGVFNPNTGTFTPSTPAQTGISALGQQALTLVGELINDPGRQGATGTFSLFSNVPGTPSYDYKAKLQRLQSLLSLDSIKYLKGTGAISDKESAILESAAAALKPGMSEDAFLKELQRVQTDLQAASGSQTGMSAQSTPYDALLQSGQISQQEYNELISSFSNDLSTSQNGSQITSVKLGNSNVQVSQSIAQKLAMADADYFKATGKHISVSEGVRSRERQAELYRRYQSGQGGRAAPPGQSFHETGNAIDVSGDWKAAEPYLRKYGFLNNLADDKHHFSIGEFA